MKKMLSLTLIIPALLIFGLITGCSNSVGSDADSLKEKDTHYKTGASVASLLYNDIQSIDLYLKDKLTGKFIKISNGDFVSPGTN